MGDDRYGQRGPGRSDSIFDDDDRQRGDDHRGFFQRAGEEVRSWLGQQDRNRPDHDHPGQGRDEPWGGGSDWRDNQTGRTSFDRGPGTSTRFPHDDHYLSWREQQISQLDRDYDEYCRERQQSFENDFSRWRERRTQGLAEGSGATTAGSSPSSPAAMPSGGASAESGATLTPEASSGSSRQGTRRKT
jgi:hypothetical protein